jgi:MerR family mercuric resistance operon transcriptional regulator
MGLHRAILRFQTRGTDSSAALSTHHLQRVRAKVTDLRKIERVLREMAAQCDGGRVPKCHVIDALFDDRSKAA